MKVPPPPSLPLRSGRAAVTVLLVLGIASRTVGAATLPVSTLRVGDVDGNGQLDVIDAVLALRDIAGVAPLAPDARAIAGLTGPKPTVGSVKTLLRAVAGFDALPWVAGSGGEQDGIGFLPDGTLLFTDYNVKEIKQVSPAGVVSTWMKTDGYPSFFQILPDGHLILCQYSGKVEDVAPDKTFTILASAPYGTTYGEPLGMAVDEHRWVYFTGQSNGEVYLMKPGEKPERILKQKNMAAGVVLTPDHRLLVAEIFGNKIWSCPLGPDGKPSGEGTVFAKVNMPHGMRMDAAGRLWVASIGENHVYVFGPDGNQLGRFNLSSSNATNVTFGPPGSKSVFIATRNPGRIHVLRFGPTDALAAGLP